jgi:hypothetical protein
VSSGGRTGLNEDWFQSDIRHHMERVNNMISSH